MKTELGILHCVLSMLLCAALVGCRGSDVVMYDARSEDVVWGSVGTDTDWRECLSMANYMAVIACLGFQDDVAQVAANDILGRDLQDAAL